jgi:hypothetical protein
MTLHCIKFTECTNIEQLDLTVPTGGSNEMSGLHLAELIVCLCECLLVSTSSCVNWECDSQGAELLA